MVQSFACELGRAHVAALLLCAQLYHTLCVVQNCTVATAHDTGSSVYPW